jgi:hypothetical protein
MCGAYPDVRGARKCKIAALGAVQRRQDVAEQAWLICSTGG